MIADLWIVTSGGLGAGMRMALQAGLATIRGASVPEGRHGAAGGCVNPRDMEARAGIEPACKDLQSSA